MERAERVGVAIGLAAISVACAVVLAAADRLLRDPMHFLEKYFGVSPDNGDGSMEALIALVVVIIIVSAGLRLATK
jgi:hypothetical protein